MKRKIYRGGEDNYPLWWYGQSNRLQNFGDRTNFLTPHGAVFQGNGYYFNSGNADYMEDIYGRHLISESTNGLWSQLYLTDSMVPPCGSLVGAGTKFFFPNNPLPEITGKFILYPEFCPNLLKIFCSSNDLTTFDVSRLTQLEYLVCRYNYNLPALDVAKLIQLSYLNCHADNISVLDVPQLIQLEFLDCALNLLLTLDVSQLTKLTTLICYSNKLASLDVSNDSKITTLDCHNNLMDQSAVDQVLCDADNWGTSDGTLDISGNTAPSSTGTDCKNNLVNRNWTVTTD